MCVGGGEEKKGGQPGLEVRGDTCLGLRVLCRGRPGVSRPFAPIPRIPGASGSSFLHRKLALTRETAVPTVLRAQDCLVEEGWLGSLVPTACI